MIWWVKGSENGVRWMCYGSRSDRAEKGKKKNHVVNQSPLKKALDFKTIAIWLSWIQNWLHNSLYGWWQGLSEFDRGMNFCQKWEPILWIKKKPKHHHFILASILSPLTSLTLLDQTAWIGFQDSCTSQLTLFNSTTKQYHTRSKASSCHIRHPLTFTWSSHVLKAWFRWKDCKTSIISYIQYISNNISSFPWWWLS